MRYWVGNRVHGRGTVRLGTGIRRGQGFSGRFHLDSPNGTQNGWDGWWSCCLPGVEETRIPSGKKILSVTGKVFSVSV
jgi:hypothetical protein